ncbi:MULTISPECIES: chlorophyllide reductase [Devosia]|uniref:chlorophyllide reductase n=1 Tax=Devosia TaxID=46913 RepID=UPI000CE97C37|nr:MULTISPECIES: chlorophyllide reductase [Devosia]AVF03096.1 chlorophyllide reductase [Devosia sp. I507]
MTCKRHILLAAALILAILPLPAQAQQSSGNITIAQVMDAMDNAPRHDHARQVLTAYLSGIGETTGVLFRQARDSGLAPSGCAGSMSLSWDGVASALRAGAPDVSEWQTTPATPIIVADMLARAGCD